MKNSGTPQVEEDVRSKKIVSALKVIPPLDKQSEQLVNWNRLFDLFNSNVFPTVNLPPLRDNLTLCKLYFEAEKYFLSNFEVQKKTSPMEIKK